MDPNQFVDGFPGRLVPLAGIPHLPRAFVPDDLPPKWEWPVHLWPLLMEAHTAIAALDGTGRHLPNPAILLKPLQNREAQKSSSLEGTVTDPQEQLLFQLEPSFPKSREDPANAFREVFNYGAALDYGLKQSELPLSLRLIRELHRILLDGVRGSDNHPGEFRKTQNQIGKPARFVPAPPQELPQLLGSLENYLHVHQNAEPRLDPLVVAFLVHYQFEAIHPFSDGNGRVGRLLLSILIAQWCGLSHQWLYMSSFFDDHKDDYIDSLLRVSTHGDWEGWISFCLRGTVIQARDTLARCERLLKLMRDYHDRINGASKGSRRLGAIVDGLFVSPLVLPTKLAKTAHVAYNTAVSDLKTLTTLDILKPLESRGRRFFYCPDIFNVTYSA